jgi:Zn-dependent M28 family amino/carboxypeptidase
VLLLATTAEEKGLLGAQYFAANPTVPKDSIVANVNLDMPTHLGPVTDAIPVGIEHSTLEPTVRRAVADAGMTLTPDPMPDEVVFVRSDQYPFIREGVPAVYLGAGIRRTDDEDGLAEFKGWLRQHYHRPSDDLNQPIDWPGAARLAIVNRNIALAISAAHERPRWNEGDFFGEKFGHPQPVGAAQTVR